MGCVLEVLIGKACFVSFRISYLGGFKLHTTEAEPNHYKSKQVELSRTNPN
jgi:hypothetical protein